MSDVASAIETLIDYRLDSKLEDAVDTAVDNALDNKLDDAVDSKIDDKISDIENSLEELKSDLEGEDDDIKSRLDDRGGKDGLDTTAIVDRLDQLELKIKTLDPRIEEAMIGVNRNLGIKNELATLLTRVINLVQDIT